uniref:Uncharacterized protein n=1 Tax=Noccaea caerulescens TaxID=107243 RepID=A0A1J3EUM7_NOCCA
MERSQVKCIFHLWSRQNLREPCVCPIDGVKMLCLRPRRPYQPEEITSLVRVYNRSFNPRLDMAQAKLSANITWLYCANTALFLAGAIAYWYKVP